MHAPYWELCLAKPDHPKTPEVMLVSFLWSATLAPHPHFIIKDTHAFGVKPLLALLGNGVTAIVRCGGGRPDCLEDSFLRL